jgi:hypothetical protein
VDVKNLFVDLPEESYRLAQHEIPATEWLHRISISHSFGKAIIPNPLGELYGVWKLPQ